MHSTSGTYNLKHCAAAQEIHQNLTRLEAGNVISRLDFVILTFHENQDFRKFSAMIPDLERRGSFYYEFSRVCHFEIMNPHMLISGLTVA